MEAACIPVLYQDGGWLFLDVGRRFAGRELDLEQRAKHEVLDDRELVEHLGLEHLGEPLVHLRGHATCQWKCRRRSELVGEWRRALIRAVFVFLWGGEVYIPFSTPALR